MSGIIGLGIFWLRSNFAPDRNVSGVDQLTTDSGSNSMQSSFSADSYLSPLQC